MYFKVFKPQFGTKDSLSADGYLFRVSLGLADELLTAAGTADADLALATGDTDTLSAMGTAEIAVGPILESCPQAQPLLILTLSQGDVLGEHPIDGEACHAGIQEAEQTVQELAL